MLAEIGATALGLVVLVAALWILGVISDAVDDHVIEEGPIILTLFLAVMWGAYMLGKVILEAL